MTRAPMLLAICNAKMETPPVPSTSTVSPACKRPSTTRARQAVKPAVVSVAASACDQSRGAWVSAVAGRVTHSRAKPSTPSPGTRWKSRGMCLPACHCGKNVETTASPTANSVTGTEGEQLVPLDRKPWLQLAGYELVRHNDAGKVSWTWRRPKAEMAQQPQHVRLPHLGLHFGDAAGLGRRFALPDCVPLSQISNLIKLQPMKVTITPAMLASAKTEAGGYTRAQMDVFGVDWPPPKGWPSFLIGEREIRSVHGGTPCNVQGQKAADQTKQLVLSPSDFFVRRPLHTCWKARQVGDSAKAHPNPPCK